MSDFYKEGDTVKWAWGKGYGKGEVQSVFTKKITRTIDGSEVTRNGSESNPAYYIRVEDGNNVVKLFDELEKD